MYPILFTIGPVRVFTYGFLLALAFLCAMFMVGQEAKRRGLDPKKFYDLSFYAIIWAIIGSRLLHVLLAWDYFIAHPVEIFALWQGGLAFQGGLVFGLISVIYLLYRYQLPLWATLDTMALAVPLGQFIGRLGCFMAGCCYGKETTVPWAVTFTHPETLARPGVPLHPTQLYESFLMLGVFLFLLRFRQRQQFSGQILGIYFLLAGTVRFIVEFWRGDERGPILFWGMASTQVIALAVALGGLIFLLWRARAAQTMSSRQRAV
ncbi:MAG: prolipoprotein diacylglyceryl transferase [Desulfobacca sp.]|uniref:prolipoprotein diacylglyceryl transferase n=1 Tax=Desulfobacca sp. TaxID=2067990 RepID=UPI00404A91B6